MNGKRARAFRAYQKVKTLKPARSLFDLSHDVVMTCDMFKLYPCCLLEMSPGDTFHIWNESVTRLQPLNAPILASISQNTHYFFVPYRILWEEWTAFITGGKDGENGGNVRSEDLDDPSEVSPELPRWSPTKTDVGSLWDYCGFPTGVNPKGALPVDFVRRCYNRIWNEYYRDENLQEEVSEDNEDILYRSWKKDYFTSALLTQQRGVSPSLPVQGTASFGSVVGRYVDGFDFCVGDEEQAETVITSSSVFTGNYRLQGEFTVSEIRAEQLSLPILYVDDGTRRTMVVSFSGTVNSAVFNSERNYTTVSVSYRLDSLSSLPLSDTAITLYSYPTYPEVRAVKGGEITATSASITDLRQAFQIQKWLELANRGGVRYTEFLRAFFGVSPRDDRLQRPEYIGGSKSPVIISEVLQTSSTTGEPTPQGYMAGHGLGASRTYVGSYTAREYGIVMGLLSYTTPPVYTQGINRQWLRRTKFDFLFPQFTGLSEQAIEGAEIYAVDNDETENRKVWGFNEVYDELRSIPSRIVGKMRSTFNYWHLARFFNSKPALNEDFISGKDVSKRIFAVQNEEGIICHYANIIRAVRPLPKYGTPKGV